MGQVVRAAARVVKEVVAVHPRLVIKIRASSMLFGLFPQLPRCRRAVIVLLRDATRAVCVFATVEVCCIRAVVCVMCSEAADENLDTFGHIIIGNINGI